MITPGGIPWYALVLNEPVLLAACVMLLLAIIGLIAWLGARSSGGRPSWRMKALFIAPIAALLAGGAVHWLQARVLADTHTASQWMLMPRDSSRPSATLMTWSYSGSPPQRSISLSLARPVESGSGIRVPRPTDLPAGSPATWPETIGSQIRALYPEMSEADASAHAATLADWAAFLSASPSPDLAQVQQRGTSGPYNVYATLDPMVRLRPWTLHRLVTMAVGLLAMIIAAMIVRQRSAAPREAIHAAARPA